MHREREIQRRKLAACFSADNDAKLTALGEEGSCMEFFNQSQHLLYRRIRCHFRLHA